MATPVVQTSFTTGEIAPSLYGRTDLAREHNGASTMRNMFVGYRGGAYSRAGTAFVGFSKQTGRSIPPRLIPFQFDINQGLALEFGDFYMRVISDGAYVTEAPYQITNITNADPAVVTVAPIIEAESATANNGAVSASYAPNNTVTLSGGTETTPAVLKVSSTTLLSLALNNPGTTGDYAPGDVLTLAGGAGAEPKLLVATTTVLAATINNAGTMGTNGTQTVTGTTGTGTKVQCSVTISGGSVTAINSITVAGDYSVNPTNPAAEPMSGAGLLGCTFTLRTAILTFSIENGGILTANPVGSAFTQGSTSGSGTGATFDDALLGPYALTVATPGDYTVTPSNPVSQASTSGSGAGATFDVTWTTPAVPADGDWFYISNVGGMTQLNGRTFVIQGVSGDTFELANVFGSNIDSTGYGAYTSGGDAARIYTLSTPYSEDDLAYLKYTQSADVMSLCLVNQLTGTEYSPQDLERFADDDWEFAAVVPASSISPPATVSVTGTNNPTSDPTVVASYAYQVTSVSPTDGTESIASPVGTLLNAVDVAGTSGTITVTWDAIPGINQYNIYKAEPNIAAENGSPTVPAPPVGSLFGYAGSAYGAQFQDSNIVQDFSQVPPTHQNPFARGQITACNVTASTGTVTTASVSITTATGSGAVLTPVIVDSVLVAVIVDDAGEDYGPDDFATVTVTGGGTAEVDLVVGPQSGTYPGCPGDFQERRVYAYSLNNPDTYWMSQPGSFTNFDFRIPTIDSDAVTGSPWSVEVNGIQFILQTPAGLLVFTGLSTWLLVGAGSAFTNVQPIAPSSQDALPQPDIGCSATVVPIKVDYDVLFLSTLGFYYDQPYQLYTLSEPIDLTVASSHLFTGYAITQSAWCRQPYKLLWAVRNDGVLLSLTWLKGEQISGWSRHDTNGSFASVCSIVEPPVDALYVVTERTLGLGTAYIVERMDNRIWPDAESAWCVDCGFSLPQPTPNATLTASSATGLGAVTGGTINAGGTAYSSGTTGTVIDAPLGEGAPPGPGTGAVPTLVFTAGVLTGISFSGGNQGSGYLNPQLVLTDPANTGSGQSVTLTLSNTMTFTASAAVFSSGDVGNVIRMGGGGAVITAYTDSEHVTGNILTPIAAIQPNSGGVPMPAIAGEWTMTTPVSSVYIPEFAGTTFTGLADGAVIPPTAISATGTLTLSKAASQIIVGMGFQAQLQTPYLEPGGSPTVQGQRKKIADVVARIEASAGIKVGSNQPDGAAMSPIQLSPAWQNLDFLATPTAKPYNATFAPLYTGDSKRIPVQSGFATPGQVAFQQDNPQPMAILAVISDAWEGDRPEQQVTPKGKRAA